MFSEQDALTLISEKRYVAAKNTGYYVCNYYSRWAEGRKYVIERSGKLYTFIIYGRPLDIEKKSRTKPARLRKIIRLCVTSYSKKTRFRGTLAKNIVQTGSCYQYCQDLLIKPHRNHVLLLMYWVH